jgi:hypothetical protein
VILLYPRKDETISQSYEGTARSRNLDPGSRESDRVLDSEVSYLNPVARDVIFVLDVSEMEVMKRRGKMRTDSESPGIVAGQMRCATKREIFGGYWVRNAR